MLYQLSYSRLDRRTYSNSRARAIGHRVKLHRWDSN